MNEPAYLQPYLTAAKRHGGSFSALLWATPQTQRLRFAALARMCPMLGLTVLDAGCGRADLLDFLREHDQHPRRYIGLEAVETLARAADSKLHLDARILRGDFVRDPHLLRQRADVIIFSGSLNTLSKSDFQKTLEAAWAATGQALAFNFLCSASLAAVEYLTWHPTQEVLDYAKSLGGGAVAHDDSYLPGDCTIVVRKKTPKPAS